MKYMLMLYADEKAGSQIPPDQMSAAMETLFAYQKALEKAGAFVATAALQPTWEARTLRMEGGEIVAQHGSFLSEGGELRVHDGPYAETREQFGGYYIIDVATMGDAIEWARRCPAAQWGPIEIRPIILHTRPVESFFRPESKSPESLRHCSVGHGCLDAARQPQTPNDGGIR